LDSYQESIHFEFSLGMKQFSTILHYNTLNYTLHLITHASVAVNLFSEDNSGDMRFPVL